MSDNNYQNHQYFQDGEGTELNAETAALAFAADDDDAGSRRQLLYYHHHHQQQEQQREHHEFITSFNNNVIMNMNHGGIEIDNHESFHHGCMIDVEDNDHGHGNHVRGCYGSNSRSDNAYDNENENNTTLVSIATNGYDHANISNNNDAINNNMNLNEFNGENHDHHDDDGENCWQVVPDSLDHLSRDELCRIIYRLDYERNALLLLREQQQQQLEQPLEFMSASASTHPKNDHRQNQESSNNYHSGHGNENSDGSTVNKRKKKRRKTKRARCGDNGDESDNFSSHDTHRQPLVDLHLHNPTISVEDESTVLDVMVHRSNVDQNQQQLPHKLQRVSWNNEFETNSDVNTDLFFTTAVEDLRSRLRQNLIDIILSSAIHGGRRVPKSTVAMEGVSYQIARAIVMPRVEESGSSDGTKDVNNIIYHDIATEDSNNSNDTGENNIRNHSTSNDNSYELIVVADTKRMIKWRITDEKHIAKMLGRGGERLIHPVRHDGTGIYVVSSSSLSSMSSTSTPLLMNDGGIDSRGSNQRAKNMMYHYARFKGLDVKYDKWEKILTIIAKTVAVEEEHGKEPASFSSA